jgi:subtilisin family serine protease
MPTGQVAGQVDAPARAGAADPAGAADKTSATVVRRKQRYLIGLRILTGIAASPNDPFLESLAQMEGVDIVRRIRGHERNRDVQATPSSAQAAASNTGAQTAASGTAGSTMAAQEIIVVRMDEQRGEELRQNAPPHVIVEVDSPLGYSEMAVVDSMGWQHLVQAMSFPRARNELRFCILGENNRPLPNAVVNLYGPGFPAQAVTDANGHASLQTYAVEGAGILAVYVRPAADHWERFIRNPSLDPTRVNTIRLSPLDRTVGSAPGERPYGWGRRVMKFDRAFTESNGAGVRVGLIDSGCDGSHALLRHIVKGLDLTRDKQPQSWKLDELGQGTHCAGIIAGAPVAPSDIPGCAPAAEVHVFKVVPGGYLSDLIEALDHCIERQLDVVHIGVSGVQYSQLVAQKIFEARLNGIACVAGSGNTGTAVQFPGNVPGVITVSAVGKLGEYPEDTRHAQRALPQLIGPAGIYAANFSGWGPQVGLCAPGVAVISSVPGGGYAAWDGGAMAAAHVVGFATLLLCRHPLFQGSNYGGRVEQRVALLYDLLRAAAIPYAQVDQNRVGAGLPDLQQVPGLLSASQPLFAGGWSVAMGAAGQQAATVPGAAYPGDPAAYRGDPMNALLQLRAAGLWV